MQKTLLIFFACLLYVGEVRAQTETQDTLSKYLAKFFRSGEPDTYVGFRKMCALKNLVLTDKYKNEGLKYSFQMQLGFSFGSMGYQDSLLHHTKNLTFESWDSIPELGDLEATNALQYLIEKVKNRRIVIINEAHHLAHHRGFTAKILEALQKEGFTYFAAEMLINDPENETYHKQGYPVKMSMTPMYDEPYSRMMFRKALQMGYQLIPYEAEDFEFKDMDTSFVKYGLKIDDDNAKRDWTQAVNIYKRALEKDKNAKIVIHVGHDHLLKVPSEGWTPMAYFLQKITGIEPFSIAQADELYFTKANYQQIMQKYKSTEPFVLLNRKSKKSWLSRYENNHSIDALVLTPPKTRDRFDNPEINYTNSKKPSHKIAISQFKQSTPYLLEVYFAGEDAKAMPVYQLEIGSPADAQKTLKLYLPKGKTLLLKLISPDGKILEEKKM